MITTQRLTLRRFASDDLPALDAVLGCSVVMAFSDHGPLDRAAQRAWLDDACVAPHPATLPGRLAVVRRRDGVVIGYVSLTMDGARVAPGEAELGFRFRQTSWGKGYAPEAVQALISHCERRNDCDRIVAIVDPNNHRSVRVLEKVGLRFDREVMFDGYDYPDHLYMRPVA